MMMNTSACMISCTLFTVWSRVPRNIRDNWIEHENYDKEAASVNRPPKNCYMDTKEIKKRSFSHHFKTAILV